MTELAIYGGPKAVTEPLLPYDSIYHQGHRIIAKIDAAFNRPLSGYLGGEDKGGYWCEKLEAGFCEAFGVKHAVAVNSATSGLLAACVAADIRRGDAVVTTPYTMSATAAAPKFLGAHIGFGDIELSHYCLDPRLTNLDGIMLSPRAIIATNLFGHPAELEKLNVGQHILIEDNAQAPYAHIPGGAWTGTVGKIGVFSLNVHKHFQCGEGGVVVTNNSEIADRLRAFRNHGEMAGSLQVGLNLRMTEVTAAIACAQLHRSKELVFKRVDIAEELLAHLEGIPGIFLPRTREGCQHVYYCLPFFLDGATRPQRNWFTAAMKAEGVPLQDGYVKPLYHLPAFRDSFTSCPNAELAHQRVMLYENCAWDPNPAQIKQIAEAFWKVAEHEDRRQRSREPSPSVHRS